MSISTTRRRGVNTTVGYVLALGITTVLISGLLVAASGTLDAQQQSVIRSEMKVVGEQTAISMTAADRFTAAERDTTGTTAYEVSLLHPDDFAGEQYSIRVEEYDPTNNLYRLVLRTNSPVVEQQVVFRSMTPVRETTVNGGALKITLDSGELVLTYA
jgi:hypothetical protein